VKAFLLRTEHIIIKYKALTAILAGTFLLRLPSLFEPLWYGDEAIYLTVGQRILRGDMLYIDIFDHKTPGIYYLAATALRTFGESVWSIKFLLMIWVLITLVVFFFVGKKLFNEKIPVVATGILAFLTSTTLIEGNIFNSEILMLLPILLGVLLGLNRKYFLAGVLFSLAVLLKVPAIFDFAAFFLFIILAIDKKSIQTTAKNLLYLVVGFFIPILLTVVYFASVGGLQDYFQSAVIYNVSYTGYGNKFIINNGLLIVKSTPIIAITVYTLYRAFVQSKGVRVGKLITYEFLLIWLILSFFGASFGGRAYEHYLIQVAPSFSLITAISLFNKEFTKIGVASLVLVLMLAYILNFRPWFDPSYYTNSFRFAANNISSDQYVSEFDPKAARNYAVASFITGCRDTDLRKKCDERKSAGNEKLYVYADHPAIYFLSGKDPAARYITFFHIANRTSEKEQTLEQIKNSNPKFIVTEVPTPGSFKSLEKLLSSRYNLLAFYENMAIYEFRTN
jgi:4-amino-4-deoxy-L-arabinose transferase-like glycosyltransferase